MQSKSKSKKKLSDLQQKYVERIRQMDKIRVIIIFTYFNCLTCVPQYHSTSGAPSTLKIASCEAKLPHNIHLLRLSFWRLPTSGTGNSLTDIKVFSIHSLSITASAIYSCSPIYSRVSLFGHERKPCLANLQVVSIQHTWYGRSLCVVWRTMQYIAKVPNKAYSVTLVCAILLGTSRPACSAWELRQTHPIW